MSELKEIRCKGCGRMLGVFSGKAEIKCTKTECSGMNIFDTDTGEHRFVPKSKSTMLKDRTTSSGVTFK